MIFSVTNPTAFVDWSIVILQSMTGMLRYEIPVIYAVLFQCGDQRLGCGKGLHTKNPNPSPIGKKFGFCCCGAPPGTRALGPLIKRNQRATIVNFQNYANSSFLAFYRKSAFCICCIPCTCYPLSHPLSSRSGVQKMCRAKISPLKQALIFYTKPEKRPGSSPKR